jgi:endonuclease/exonuclease/phosphatase family metal-dependent hydrolase
MQPLLATLLALWTIFRLVGYITEPRLSAEEIHRIVGEPARTADPGSAPRQIKLATWNIARGVRYDRILAALREFDADVILLQEVDMFCGRSGFREVAKDLAAALDMNWVASGEFQEVGEGRRGRAALSGQAVLSKYRIDDPAVIVFKEQARLRWRLNPVQPRRGGRMTLKARTAGILAYNTHIESGGDEDLRRSQVEEILADHAAEPDTTPAVIAGDFNNPPWGQTRMFEGVFKASFVDALSDPGSRRTTSNRDHGIDWIFVRNLAAADGQVVRVENASDHYPLTATLAREP